MKWRWFVATAVVAGLIGWCASGALTDEEMPSDNGAPSTEAPAVPSTLDHVREVHERHVPGEAHELFKRMVGTWDVEWTLQMGEGEPLHGKGVIRYRLLYGGRFVLHEFEGAGEKDRGMGLMGYNNETKRYESTWVASWSTAIHRGDATFDAHTGVLATSFSLLTSQGPHPMRIVEVWGKDGTVTSTLYGGAGPHEHKVKESTLTRREPAASQDREE